MSYQSRLDYSKTIDSSRQIPPRRKKKLHTNGSGYSLSLSQLAESNPNNSRNINLFSQMINYKSGRNTQYLQNSEYSQMPSDLASNTNYNSSRSQSKIGIPLNLVKFESMIDDMNDNIYGKIKTNRNDVDFIINNLTNSIENLQNQIQDAKFELKKTDKNIAQLEQQNEDLLMSYERTKSENFHNQIELTYTRKKIADIKNELDDLQREGRSTQYENFKLKGYKNQFGIGLKADASRINQLMEEKKCLKTSILIINKKLNKLKKEVAMYCLKGEYTLDRFGDLVEKTKRSTKFKSP